MTSNLLYFIAAILVVAALSVAIYVKRPKAYFKTEEGRSVASGIVLAVGAVLVLAVSAYFLKAEAGELKYLDKGEVFIGLDQTKDLSPMCVSNQASAGGGNSDRLTSNLGVRAELIATEDDVTSVSMKYTHHSCAFNADYLGYDALGIEIKYRLW